jgi:2-oxoglutarate dehydrogenase complex dehydrogenase (E1) component-like enzyme
MEHLQHQMCIRTRQIVVCTLATFADECKSAEETERRAALGLNYSHFGIRLSGQDSERGTFNQRHAAMYDVNTRRRLFNMVHPTQDQVEIYNSPLSEAAVLAFEYGHSVGSKDKALVLWEAQFGDFTNNAQVSPPQLPRVTLGAQALSVH